MSEATASFTGFASSGLELLRDLAENNDRAWFAERKERFESELFGPLRALIAELSEAMARARLPLRGDPKRSAFRIYRDVRFSPDKRPFKTNLGAYLTYDGARETPGGLYVHIQPKASFAAVAFHDIEKPLLQRWRSAMASDPRSFRRVLAALERNGCKLDGPEKWGSLVRMPRGFEAQAESDLADFFRLRSFVVSEALSDSAVRSAALVERLVKLTKAARPLLDYGWSLV